MASGVLRLRVGSPLLGVVLPVLFAACGRAGERSELTYVGRDSCADCHAAEVEAYTGSDHDRAMEHATTETVLGDFSGVTVTRQGVETRFFLRDGRHLVATDGPTGAIEEYEVLYTFGVRPLQQYLVELEPGRIQRLPWSWDTRPADAGGQRWFHTYGDEPIAAGDVLHWTRPSQNWNRMCADCHSTDLRRRYDSRSGRYATTWSEIDVSCEACHGPASAHLAWALEGENGGRPPAAGGFPVALSADDMGSWVRDGAAPTAHRGAPRTDATSLETCARCHAHRTPIAEYEPGARFADAYRLSLPTEPLYHADGQVKEEVFVYGSFLQSKMYRAGVTCTNCHEPHSGGLRVEGNGLCTQCHSGSDFDTKGHHRHEPSVEAPGCADCHMPTTPFMQVDPRRDHGFRIPRPTIDEAPNACVGCHAERDLSWVRSTLDAWYGPPRDSTRIRATAALRAAERGERAVGADLVRVAADTLLNPIVRAAAVSYLDRYPSQESAGAMVAATSDGDPFVRAAAVRGLTILEPATRVSFAAPLLTDSTLLVRVAAARALAGAPSDAFDAERLETFEAASAEYERSRQLNADDPAAIAELADYLGERGRLVEAEAQYLRAIALEPDFVPAYLNLAELYRALGREESGRETLERGVTEVPDAGTLHYALGLLHVRLGRLGESLGPLARATELDPADGRYAVAYGLALERAGRSDEAVAALDAARARVADRRPVLLTLVELHRGRQEAERAVARAEELVAAFPDDASLVELLALVRSEFNR